MATTTMIKVGGTLYPTVSLRGVKPDAAWDGRHSIAVRLRMSYAAAAALLTDGVAWSVVQRTEHQAPKLAEDGTPVVGEDGAPVMETVTQDTETDYSAWSLSGDITDHRDGTVTVKMGKPTELEVALANAVSEEELTNAYIEGVNSL